MIGVNHTYNGAVLKTKTISMPCEPTASSVNCNASVCTPNKMQSRYS